MSCKLLVEVYSKCRHRGQPEVGFRFLKSWDIIDIIRRYNGGTRVEKGGLTVSKFDVSRMKIAVQEIVLKINKSWRQKII
jgi:hypothetical protein